MKLFIYVVLLATGFSYSQTFRYFSTDVPRTIVVCAKWSIFFKLKHTSDNTIEKDHCQRYQSCSLLPYTTEEPVIVSCNCSIRYSEKHPEYSPEKRITRRDRGERDWTSEGIDQDVSAAKAEARQICTYQYNFYFDDKPEHWITSTRCGVKYRYNCPDDSITMQTHYDN